MKSSYDKFPVVRVTSDASACREGWEAIAARMKEEIEAGKRVICIECYPGVFEEELQKELSQRLPAVKFFRASECLRSSAEIDSLIEGELTRDPVFGRLSAMQLEQFFDKPRLGEMARMVKQAASALVIGTGASLIVEEPDCLIYADLARWEIQRRQRSGEIGNLGAENAGERPGEKYKRSFFVDWRVADRVKKRLLEKLDFLLDTNKPQAPKMISGDDFRAGLAAATSRPFRVQPFFDPGPWGGQWMRKVCELPDGPPNYAWCFDCVPEENSLLLGFGTGVVEVPAIDLVFRHPRELLGEAVHARFGTEFPIRFDFLDTMGGGNLSLQVHPLTEYIAEHFGMRYTQDESYYLLDAGEDACVYLGFKDGIDRAAMLEELSAAQAGGAAFEPEKYVNQWPAKKHDHFLIPAGTIHCSGRNSMVLEISATPYIFTFKLWDWGRLGLDGRPRPIHLEHGARNLQWDRTTGWVRRELVNCVREISRGGGWREEQTGLHEREFIETRRHWFTGVVPHDTQGGLNVLNLVQGEAALVESPEGAFEPFEVHYAETFIVPAAVGRYTIRPSEATAEELATVKAFVRTRP